MLRIRRIRIAVLSLLLGVASAAVLPGVVSAGAAEAPQSGPAPAAAAPAVTAPTPDLPPESAQPVPAPAPAAVSVPVIAAAAPAATPAPVPAPAPTTVAVAQPAPNPAAAPAPAPAPAVRPGQEATVSIPSVGINLPVVFGGQSVIDTGVVAHYNGGGWKPAVPAGSPGTYWLAAHHATHGSPFGNLPAVRPGAKVIVTTASGHTYTYTVTSLEEVGTTATFDTVYGPDSTTPRILLQTCDGATRRVLVHGVLTSAA